MTHAQSVYQVTPATGTVGTDLTTLEIEYTVDTAEQTWADSDTLIIQVPNNFLEWPELTVAVEFDEDANNDDVGESAIAEEDVDNIGEYSIAGNQLTVEWDETAWTTVTGNTIRILVTAGAVPQYSNATSDLASTFIFGGTTAAAGDTNPNGNDAIVVSFHDPAATFNATAIATVGSVGSVTIQLWLPIDLEAGNSVGLTFPAQFDIDAADTVVMASSFDAGAATFTAEVNAQTLSLQADDAVTAGQGTITITGIVSAYQAAPDSVSVGVETTFGNGEFISSTTDAIAATTAATLGGTPNVQPAALDKNTPTTVTVTFTSIVEVDNDDVIVVTFPTNYNVSSASGGTCASMDGDFATTVAGLAVTITRSNGTDTPAGAMTCTIANVITPFVSGVTGGYTIQVFQTGGVNLVQTATAAGDVIVGSSGGAGASRSYNNSSSSSSSSTTGATTTTTTTTTTTGTTTGTAATTDETATTEADTDQAASPAATRAEQIAQRIETFTTLTVSELRKEVATVRTEVREEHKAAVEHYVDSRREIRADASLAFSAKQVALKELRNELLEGLKARLAKRKELIRAINAEVRGKRKQDSSS
ncbi:MAG: hypothetical protein Q8P95_02575 [bacterium]|nr:hypothetical protein [bacterium]